VDSPSHRPHSFAALTVVVGAVVAVGAVIGGAYWLLRFGDDANAPMLRDSTGTAAARADQDSQAGAMRTQVEAAGANSGMPPCEPGPADGLLVRAVATDDGRPIAGAQIYVVPERNTGERSLYQNALQYVEDPRRLASAGARGFLGDAKGEVRVVRPAFDAFLLGFAGDRRGAMLLFEPGSAAVELRFARACDLVVQVVDATGAPVCDARVTTASRKTTETVPPGTPDYRPALLEHDDDACSDGSGLARLIAIDLAYLRHLQSLRTGKFVFCVVVPYLGSPELRGACDVEDFAQRHGPVRVVVEEPFGVLEVRVGDARGRSSGGTAIVRASGGKGFGDYDVEGGRLQERPLEKGVARFAPVALGASFEISARLEGGGTVKKTAQGPQVAGEVVRVDLDPVRDRHLVRGRLVGFPAPLGPHSEVAGELGRAPPTPDSVKRVPPERRAALFNGPFVYPIRADLREDGSFEIDVTPVRAQPFGTLCLRGFERAQAFGFEAAASLADGLVDPVTELGEITVAAIPVLAAGRIVDDLQRPLAQVAISFTKEGWQYGPIISDTGPRTTSDVDGNFALVGNAERLEQEIGFVPPPGFASSALPLPAEGLAMEVVLPRTGRIVGTLAADFDVMLFAAARSPQAGALSLAPPTLGRREFYARRDGVGATVNYPFTFELRPGHYDLLVSTTPNDPRSGVVAWVDEIEVRPAEVTVDPRLSPLIVARERTAWRIHLSRSDGAPPPGAWVRLAPPDAPTQPWRNYYVATGESTFESALESAWIDVDAVSFKRVHELHGRGDVSIVLEPLEQRKVEIALDAGDAPHCYDLHWIVAADSSRPLPSPLRDNYSTTVVAGGTSSLSLDEGECWKLRLFAQIDAGGAPRRVELARCMQEVSTRGDASEMPAKVSFVVYMDEVDALWQELSKSE
jgi:hypothetical protein